MFKEVYFMVLIGIIDSNLRKFQSQSLEYSKISLYLHLVSVNASFSLKEASLLSINFLLLIFY
ncbi:hypothetical protein MCERE19_00026 [Spirosomataceae bacterium]|jgi:hypothetical protein